jgi:ABC-type uncharacterized transport system substrate-binding protein
MIRRIATAGAMPIVLLALALALSGAAPMADAQPPQKARRIGFLIAGWPNSDIQEVFVQGMRELGWVPSRNVDIEFRFAEGNDERLAALAADLARKNVEIIVAAGTRSASVASKATRSIPIVMLNASDPARIGLVASLAQPAGNVTGTAYTVGSETFGKGLALLREVIPGIRHVAILSNPANPAQPLAIENIKLTAQSLGLRLLLFEAKRAAELDDVFAAIAKERADALLVVPEALFIQSAPADRARPQASASDGVRHRGGRSGRGSHVLWTKPRARLSARCDVRGQDPQGREAGRPAGRAADEVRARDQPQDREDAWLDGFSVAVAASRSGDRVKPA